MTISTIDTRTALIVVDLQNAIRAYHVAHPVEEVFANAGALADAFRAYGLPVVLVNVAGRAPGRIEAQPGAQAQSPMGERPADALEFVSELHRTESDHVVTKRTWGAFTATDLDAYLRSEGVTQVVIAGIATSAGVESTARQAHEFGYNVTLATDAMSDRSAEAHDHVVSSVFPRIGETGTTAEVIELLASTRA
ncbi:isochorismatase family protein [Leifsonia sp. NCR5]|uniref:isochorismatase family protein n=1 Tax=Leifsonia sp. NCR5 TaxID=1978342 RepID=UPI000A18AF7A|nr:isochorismatase family protein [Leifsonia sp. NCR5]